MYTSALDRARTVAEKFRTASGWQPGTLVARGTGQKATEASLYIYQPIGSDMWTGEGITADSVRKALDAAKGVSTLHVHINSEGGAVFEAFGIYTLLRNLSAKKVVHVDGLAASAASFIAMAGAGEGNEIITSPVAKWMVHEAWTIAAGRASEMRATAERLEMMNETLAQAYAEQTGKTVEQCLAIMNAETWMTAQQALDLGFTDSIAEFDEEPAQRREGGRGLQAGRGHRRDPPDARRHRGRGDRLPSSPRRRPGADGEPQQEHPGQPGKARAGGQPLRRTHPEANQTEETNMTVMIKQAKVKTEKQNEAATTMEKLQARFAEIASEALVLQNTAASDDSRNLNEDELAKMKALNDESHAIEAQIDALNTVAALQERAGTPLKRRVSEEVEAEVTEPEKEKARPARSILGGDKAGVKPGMWGHRSLGAFALAAKATHMGKPDARIMNAPTSFGSEGINQDGGFLVPPDFREQIKQLLDGEESLSARVDQVTTSGNSLVLPLDSVSPWDTSNGVQVNWTGEGKAITQSKPQMGQLETKLHKVSALVPITEELMEDVPALTGWLNTKVPQKFNSELNNVIINGNGIAKPTGFLSAGCLVTQAAKSAQGAGTVITENVLNMYARLYAPLRRNALWLINQDVEPQLQTMVMPGTTPAIPAYLPPGGLSQKPYGTLLGLPVMPLEACQALGTLGDILLVDPTQYLLALKGSGIKSDVSIHLYFDTGHTAFRFEMRVGGQSYWPAAIARAHGSNTLSPVIGLSSTRT
jgi:HK97 family phage major capsid protein